MRFCYSGEGCQPPAGPPGPLVTVQMVRPPGRSFACQGWRSTSLARVTQRRAQEQPRSLGAGPASAQLLTLRGSVLPPEEGEGTVSLRRFSDTRQPVRLELPLCPGQGSPIRVTLASGTGNGDLPPEPPPMPGFARSGAEGASPSGSILHPARLSWPDGCRCRGIFWIGLSITSLLNAFGQMSWSDALV